MRENNPAVLYFECEVVYSSFSNSLLPLPLHFFFLSVKFCVLL